MASSHLYAHEILELVTCFANDSSVLEFAAADKDARLFKHVKANLEEAIRAVREYGTHVADG